jgi:leucyl-tRNA synthetase
VKSSKDHENIKKAKDEVYLLGFYEGTMLIGDHKGLKVKDAKPLVKKFMIE